MFLEFTSFVLIVPACAGDSEQSSSDLCGCSLSFPATGTVSRAAKEDGRTGGLYGSVQKQCGDGVI